MDCDFGDIEEGAENKNVIPIMAIQKPDRSIIHGSLAKFRLGKIISKHIIIEVFSFAGFRNKITQMIGSQSTKFRDFLKINRNLFMNVCKDNFIVDKNYIQSLLINSEI